MDAGSIGWLVTFLLFGGIGWMLAVSWKRPAGIGTWLVLIAATLISSRIGVETALLMVDDFAIMMNGALMALCLGAMARLWYVRRVGQAARAARPGGGNG